MTPSNGNAFFEILSSVRHPVLLIDDEHVVAAVNAPLCEYVGASARSIEGRPLGQLATTRLPVAPIQRLLEMLATSGKRAELELELPEKEGRSRYFWIAADRLPTQPEEAGGCMLQLVDRTAERHRDQELERLALLVETSQDAIIGADLAGQVTSWNRGAERLFGYLEEEMVGQNIAVIVPANRRDELLRVFDQVGRGEDPKPLETIRFNRHGKSLHVEVTHSPITSETGETVGASAIFRDITARKQAELKSERLKRELMRKNEEMEQFVYTVSHDLKSPLVTTAGFVGLLKTHFAKGDLEKAQRAIEKIEKSTSRMSQLIDELLELSRIGRVSRESAASDMGGLAREVVAQLEPSIAEKSARVEIEPDMPTLMVDRLRFQEVYENLLTNALKYGCGADSPRIDIGCVRVEDEMRLFVRDNGQGIDPKYHHKIFGLFQRLGASEDGTGVGLAIVSRIAAVHNGRVWVESALGEGASFWIALPTALHVETKSPTPIAKREAET